MARGKEQIAVGKIRAPSSELRAPSFKDGWMNGWREGWREGWMDGGMDGGMEGWINGCTMYG
eukprot:scaffold301_cov243-Pinguiococcus_pyrenoidosus.AAC.8